MRRMNKAVTALLILLSLAGAGFAVLFLKHENELAQGRQEKMRQLTEQLQPINEQRRELQNKNKEWEKTLSSEKEGKSCVILCFNTMGENLYETMYDMMEQYSFRGTFVLNDGNVPGYGENSVTGEQVSEMLNDGWEYAIAEGLELKKESTSYPQFLMEEETETSDETDGETTAEEGEGAEEAPRSWIDRIDEHLATLDGYGMSRPSAVLCTQEQYEEISGAALTGREINTVCVLNTEEFPVIEEKGEGVRKVDSGLYTQGDSKVEESIANAVNNHKSMAICINEVLKISEDAGYDLSITRFTSLLNLLKGMEEQGEIYVLTFSEFLQYEQQQQQEYDRLEEQYAKFRVDMNEQMEELDRQEEEIVDSLESEETGEQGIWKLL